MTKEEIRSRYERVKDGLTFCTAGVEERVEKGSSCPKCRYVTGTMTLTCKELLQETVTLLEALMGESGDPEHKQVTHSDMSYLPKIVAVDFDGTLVRDAFPKIGDKNEEMFALCKELQSAGVKLILWTSRANDTSGRNLDAAVAYCKEQGLEFDAVNENLKEVREMFGGDTRKVYADLYIDDKSIPHTMSPSYWAERLGLTFTLGRGIYDAS